VVGYTTGQISHAFFYEKGILKDIGTLGGSSSYATAINSVGQVTGHSMTAKGATHAFLYDRRKDSLKDLGALGGGYSDAFAINAGGQVVGQSTISTNSAHAFLYNNNTSTMKDLGTLGGATSQAVDINDAGQVTGDSQNSKGQTHAFFYNGSGPLKDLGTLGGTSSNAVAINKLGQVLGNSPTSSDPLHAFIYDSSKNTIKDLGTLGGSYSHGFAINAGGQVVGYSGTSIGANHGFLYDPKTAVITDLNDLLPANSGWQITNAFAINDNGQILALGTHNGSNSYCLLTPSLIAPAILVPRITTFSPGSGKVGDTVTIKGSNLAGATVTFNGKKAVIDALKSSATMLVVTVPAEAISGNITVSTSAGDDTSAAIFTVIEPLPRIDRFTPTSGGPGTAVTIIGANLQNTTSVQIATHAAGFTVDSDTKITAYMPFDVNGFTGSNSGPIDVRTRAGFATSGSASNPQFFTILLPPRIDSINPPSGPEGALVTLTGLHLTGARVYFGSLNNPAVAQPGSTDSNLIVKVPVGAIGGPLLVDTPANLNFAPVIAGNFTVLRPAPRIDSFTPDTGSSGTPIIIRGANFTGATAVKINGLFAGFTVDSPTQITAFLPPLPPGIIPPFAGGPNGPATGPISVTTPSGTATSATNFTFLLPPRIDTVTPLTAREGDIITIHGIGFSDTIGVFFTPGIAAPPLPGSTDTDLRVRVPLGAITGPISISNMRGLAAGPIITILQPPPTITGFTPATAPVLSPIVITGTNLTGATSVTINGFAAGFTVNSDTRITAFVPLPPPGATLPLNSASGPIRVTTSGGTATSIDRFTFQLPPRIDFVSPLAAEPGALVTIRGQNLNGVIVYLNGMTALPQPGSDDQQVIFKVPNFPPGFPGIIGGTSFLFVQRLGDIPSNPLPFTVLYPPQIDSFTPGTGIMGSVVTIRGTNIGRATVVKFNGVPATFLTNTINEIMATVPAGAKTGFITVITPDGTATSNTKFIVIPPSFTFTPVNGPVGTKVTLLAANGADFRFVIAVKFNGVNAQITPGTPGSNMISVTVPAGATTGPITVTLADGTIITSDNDFIVITSPTGSTGSSDSIAHRPGATLSHLVAQSSLDQIQLVFLTNLDATAASNAAHFVVTVNGHAVGVEAASYNATKRSVVLSLPEHTLQPGRIVTVTWTDLADSAGHRTTGSSQAVAR